MWRTHLAPLKAAGYRLIAPDLPGFGQAHVEPGDLSEAPDPLEQDPDAVARP